MVSEANYALYAKFNSDYLDLQIESVNRVFPIFGTRDRQPRYGGMSMILSTMIL